MIKVSIYIIIALIYIYNLFKGKNWFSKLFFALIFMVYLYIKNRGIIEHYIPVYSFIGFTGNYIINRFDDTFVFLFYLSIIIFIYRVVKDSRDHWIKLANNIQRNRKNLMIKYNKEIFFFNNQEGIAFNKNNNKFEYIKMIMSKEKDVMNKQKPYTTNGFSEQFQDDFFIKNEISFHTVKDFSFDSSETTRIVSSKKSFGNKIVHDTETDINYTITVILENDIKLYFYSLYFKHHTYGHPLMVDVFSNRDINGSSYGGFAEFYKKYGLLANSNATFENSFSSSSYNEDKTKKLSLTEAIIAMLTIIAKSDGLLSKEEAKIIMLNIDDFVAMEKDHNPNGDITLYRTSLVDISKYVKDNNSDISFYANSIKNYDIKLKETIISKLVEIAYVDEYSNVKENLIFEVGNTFSLPEIKIKKIIQMNSNESRSSSNNTNPYKVLGVKKEDNDSEIKKRYKELVKKFHPDFIQGKDLDAEFVEFANTKMQEINSSYEQIKKERNFR